ncbi:hypothetical protein C1N80_06230 [Brachybacterium sp. SGAir0954]|uniref:hypothetical protein n=1 Tax=Brachybacterium sp. SGAir0954 TaxID=2571029 RepID=UPI0010CD1F26|nr:hypothetical protein [Brachybacterium sp. SGAir0954]QCR54945.1 hypothetical protein C1N80_06230 [Brachybacterium sp. SGAir0954]
MAVTAPKGLGSRGRRLWREITEEHDLDPMQRVLLEEACRCADRLDRLEEKLSGREGAWAHLMSRVDLDDEDTRVIELRVDGALSEARQQQNVFKQLLASLRLPDAAGVRPQQRGGGRGSYAPKTSGTSASKVVSLADRFG